VQVTGPAGALLEVGLAHSQRLPDPQSHCALEPRGDAQAGNRPHAAARGPGRDGESVGQLPDRLVGVGDQALVGCSASYCSAVTIRGPNSMLISVWRGRVPRRTHSSRVPTMTRRMLPRY
jgi:hypothetical protein